MDVGAINRSGMIIFRELPCRHQHRHELVSFGRQAIFYVRRLLSEVRPVDKAILLEFSQVLSQHFMRDPRYIAKQL